MNHPWPSDPRDHHDIDVLIRRSHRWRASMIKVFLKLLLGNACRLARQAVSSAVRVARRAVINAVQRRRRQAAVTELTGLDDRTLKDLGIHRSQIHALVHGLDVSHPRANARPEAPQEVTHEAVPGVVSHQLPRAGCSDAGYNQVVKGG